MESSSDESFAWTNASYSSNSSIDNDKIVQHNMTENGLEDDTDYGSNYKKKLQRKLFVKNEATDDSDHDSSQKREKKTKHKRTDTDIVESPKKKKIKLEPESERDTPKKKKKANASQLDELQDNVLNEDMSQSYINLDDSEHDSSQKREKKTKRKRTDTDIVESPKKKKIKLEPESDKDTPKKKKKANASQDDELQDNVLNEDVSKSYINQDINVKEEQGLVSPTPKLKKQRKNKQSNVSMSLNDMENNLNMNGKEDDDNTELHETSCTINNESYTKKKKKRKRQHSLCDDDHASITDKGTEDTALCSQLNQTEHVENNKNLSVKKEKSKHKQDIKNEYCSSDKTELLSDDENQTHEKKHKLKSHNSIDNRTHIPGTPNKRESRISDRIQFEEANNTQMDTIISNQADNTYLRKTKKFLKTHKNLTQIPMREHSEWTLNANDDIWAIRCPQNVDIMSFLGTNIKLDRKCKIKVDNQTYVGSMNNETSSITVLSAEHNNYVIKKLPLSGTLNLHRKIPKVHVPDDNIILDNQTDFLPLPDTKNRHPLFGSNYKKAIKVPSAVAQKLNESYSLCESIVEKVKKKKHKKDKNKTTNEQTGETQESAFEDTIVSNKKKKKKRKYETDIEQSSKKHKKHAADSSAVWESEQAIEENLFNF